MKNSIVILFAATFALYGCGKLNLYNKDSKSRVVASVGDNSLYMSDLEAIFTPNMTKADSTATAETFIKDWIRGELKYAAAEQALQSNQQDIDRMVKEYRTQLVRYKYESDYVEQYGDTVVTPDQISQYYRDNRANFKLVGPVVKARVVRIPADLRGSGKMEDMFRSRESVDRVAFQNICDKNGYKYDNYSNEWVDFNVVISHLPFDIKDFEEFLRNKKYFESQDDEYKYMLYVESYLLAGDVSPESRERKNIHKLLLYKRRSELLKALDDSLYNEAQREKKFVINK